MARNFGSAESTEIAGILCVFPKDFFVDYAGEKTFCFGDKKRLNFRKTSAIVRAAENAGLVHW